MSDPDPLFSNPAMNIAMRRRPQPSWPGMSRHVPAIRSDSLKVPENGVEVIATGPPLPRQVLSCGQGASWPPLDTARRCAHAVHRAADQANPL